MRRPSSVNLAPANFERVGQPFADVAKIGQPFVDFAKATRGLSALAAETEARLQEMIRELLEALGYPFESGEIYDAALRFLAAEHECEAAKFVELTARQIFNYLAKAFEKRLRAAENFKSPVDTIADDQLVTLNQAAAFVNSSNKTMRRFLNDLKYRRNKMPQPCIKGIGGQPHQWRWSILRRWLEKEFGRKLPARLPSPCQTTNESYLQSNQCSCGG